MPKREDLETILVLGAGPIVIGQACEFDYSGTQAVKALREEGYRVVLVNSNPATIMTDPGLADRTYIEPLDVETVEKIIRKERPDAVLPTVGGQTALNLAMDLAEAGVLRRHGVELIGADPQVIARAEDREIFKEVMAEAGLPTARSGIAKSLEEAQRLAEHTGFPSIIRPSYTLGGSGGGTAYNLDEFKEIVSEGLALSPTHEVLIEESLLGWKEYELELVRDSAGNGIVVCSIENLDAMGVHTGDSITVAPAQTLSDREYQRLRDMGLRVMDAVGVTTGGSNVQFAVDPESGRVIIIEMNPRVSRSSALASKATGFPIAKIAAKLAAGYTLPELPNDITGGRTPASFEPALDYVVVKVPRWDFKKFRGTKPVLGTAMKSVGEVMAIGRTFAEALQKALRSREDGRDGWAVDGAAPPPAERVRELLLTPTPERIFAMRAALVGGMGIDEVAELTGYDRWFLDRFVEMLEIERRVAEHRTADIPAELLRLAKRHGYSDAQIARLTGSEGHDGARLVRDRRIELDITTTFHRVDTCAAEYPAETPYLYSSFGTECEAAPTDRRKVLILGSGPNRIGQGLEFDYCCVHAVQALREQGFETIMVNCNPETVSTDYDTADRLYFEPLTLEHVLDIIELERPEGVLLQFGGQTPLKLAKGLEAAGVPLWGTPPEAIDRAEDRERFGEVLDRIGLRAPAYGAATSWSEARQLAADVGYPVMVRPSYVLGGQGMAVIDSEQALDEYLGSVTEATPDHPVLIDRFLEEALEVDVDAVADGSAVTIAGVMQQIELAGIHSGDSACVIPPVSLSEEAARDLEEATVALATELGVVGLLNVQFAVKDGDLYVLEANPRASRTIPFVSKATGVPWAAVAARAAAGVPLSAQDLPPRGIAPAYCVKEVTIPWRRFPGAEIALGPEMRSTGEAMGIGDTFGEAFAKAERGCSLGFPTAGTAFFSVNEPDKHQILPVVRGLVDLGFSIVATAGTRAFLQEHGLEVRHVYKVNEGRPNVADLIVNGDIDLIVNTPLGQTSIFDEQAIRKMAIRHDVLCVTTAAGASAALEGIRALRGGPLEVRSLQEMHGERETLSEGAAAGRR